MKRSILAAVSALALVLHAAAPTAPALAQADKSAELSAEELAALGGLFGDMFGESDPLTAEQEARVPAAMQVVAKLMPEGTLARMMDESMRPMMDGMMGNVAGTPAIAVSSLTGLSPLDLVQVDDKKLEEALSLLDPDSAERNEAISTAFFELISEVMVEVEPAYRAGLARAYAVRFTKAELTDLVAFFETPTGSKYAAESYLIFADPQVMSSMNEMMPAVMQRMPAIMETVAQTSEKYPRGRSYSELSDGEQARLAALLGVSDDELAASEPALPEGEIETAYEDA